MDVYLDHAATTACRKEVAEKMSELMCVHYGNPSSLHKKGFEAEKEATRSRETIAGLLKVDAKEIYFTSGGTESDNMAIFGAAACRRRSGKHVITTMIEHPAVLECMKKLETDGYELTAVRPDSAGIVRPETIRSAMRPDTILVSVMHVNNEVGSVQPLEQIGEVIREVQPNALFHSDCVQSFGKYVLRPKKWGIDLLSISSHKCHGPKGVGALYIREGVNLPPLMYGGGHQRGMRPGTENVPGAVGFAMAASLCYEQLEQKTERLYTLRSRLTDGLQAIGGVHIHGGGQREETAPHIVSVSFQDVSAEVLLHTLEESGIYVSSGSACSSNHPSLSHVLQAMEAPAQTLRSTIRFSFGEGTTAEEIDYTLQCLYNCVPVLRRFVRR